MSFVKDGILIKSLVWDKSQMGIQLNPQPPEHQMEPVQSRVWKVMGLIPV